MYSVKKFPDYERDTWIAENEDAIADQLNFEDFSKEALKNTLEQVMGEYLFLSSVNKEVVEWKQNFARFLSYAINAAETEMKQSKGREDFDGGRLSMIKEILEWF